MPVGSNVALGDHHSLQSLHDLLSCLVEAFVLLAFRRCLLFQYKDLSPKLVFLIDEKVKSALVPAFPGTALHKMAYSLFQTRVRLQRCLFMMTHKACLMTSDSTAKLPTFT